MRRLHIVPEVNEANGVWKVAEMLAHEDGGEVLTAESFNASDDTILAGVNEVWVHGFWLPKEWKACSKVLHARLNPQLIRMTHGSLSPVYLARQGKWKKRLVGPVERWLLRRADRVVATCAAEAEWIRAYEPRVKKVEVVDLKRFFRLDPLVERASCPFASRGDEQVGANGQDARSTRQDARSTRQDARSTRQDARSTHLLYLGRRHPLKGVEFLERAVGELVEVKSRSRTAELRIVSDHFGEELERDWAWCDVLVLPTLSENFGLVVAEALERGKRVVVTDGAPAWAGDDFGGRLQYLIGYRDGSDETRVELLKRAIRTCLERA